MTAVWQYASLLTQNEGHDILTLAFNVLKLASFSHSSHHRLTVCTKLPLLAPRLFFKIDFNTSTLRFSIPIPSLLFFCCSFINSLQARSKISLSNLRHCLSKIKGTNSGVLHCSTNGLHHVADRKISGSWQTFSPSSKPVISHYVMAPYKLSYYYFIFLITLSRSCGEKQKNNSTWRNRSAKFVSTPGTLDFVVGAKNTRVHHQRLKLDDNITVTDEAILLLCL